MNRWQQALLRPNCLAVMDEVSGSKRRLKKRFVITKRGQPGVAKLLSRRAARCRCYLWFFFAEDKITEI